MYSEENEKLAEAAHNLWRASHPDAPTWDAFPNKHIYRDLVLTYQRNPRVLVEPSELEQCVIGAIAAAKNAAAVTEDAPKPKARVTKPEPEPEPEKPKTKKK